MHVEWSCYHRYLLNTIHFTSLSGTRTRTVHSNERKLLAVRTQKKVPVEVPVVPIGTSYLSSACEAMDGMGRRLLAFFSED